MTRERIQSSEDGRGDIPDHLTIAWTQDHLDLRTALRAYEAGIMKFGESQPLDPDPEKIALLKQKIKINVQEGAKPFLSENDIYAALSLYPKDWIEAAACAVIEYKAPALFVLKEYKGGNYFIAGIETKDEAGNKYFNGNKIDGDEFYRQNELIPPPGDHQYHPGQYFDKDRSVAIHTPPLSIINQFSEKALREYEREVLIHEFSHAVLRPDIYPKYGHLMNKTHTISAREPVSASRYSELYRPFLDEPLNLEDYWNRSAVQEENGELISAYLRGWGATPSGIPMRLQDRSFGGQSYQATGKSGKLMQTEELMKLPLTV